MSGNKRFLTVNGKRFHHIWLRDNCLCPNCFAENSFQRVLDISDFQSPTPLSVEQQNGDLRIVWDETPTHESLFPVSWLMNRAYDTEPKPLIQVPETVLWDKDWLENHPPQRHDIHSVPESVWMDDLLTFGFTILKNMAVEELEPFLASIGPLIDTEFGAISDVRPTPGSKDVGYSTTGPELRPHNGHVFKQSVQALLFFYCVEHEAEGGESLLIDGFRVAEDFRKDHPDDFQLLVDTPATFWRFDAQCDYYFSTTLPIIELDKQGKVSQIRFNAKNCDRTLPFDQTERFYEAYTAFMHYLKKSEYNYLFRMKAGEIQIIQNSRILHGRTPFNPDSGLRHLKAGLMDWDYVAGRRNFHQVKHLYMRG